MIWWRRAEWLGAGWFVAVVIAASAWMFVWPISSRPGRAGAILVLNGSDNAARTSLGVKLAERGVAPVLLYSVGDYSPGRYAPFCPRISGVTVVCFVPRPARTVGEIAFAARYARQHGVGSIVIVAGQAQDERARLLARRCFPGASYVVAAGAPWWQIPGQVLYEWGAVTKAMFIDTGCS